MKNDALIIHELFLSGSDHLGYRVFEVLPENFEATCKYLSVFGDGVDDQVSNLIAFRHLPAIDQIEWIPPGICWLHAEAGIAALLDQLRWHLLEPLSRPGMIGVDHADYRALLGMGGCIRLMHVWDFGIECCFD